MKLPTDEQCLNYFEKYHVPGNILKHCKKVRDVAIFLAEELQKKGIDVNIELVGKASYLHDLFKVVVLEELTPSEQYHPEDYTEDEIAMWKQLREKYSGKYESEVAHEIFKDEFPELALVVKNSSDPYNMSKTWEELVVHYADWRITGEEIIVLDKRLVYLRQRYPRDDDAWDKYEHVIKADEEKIFENLPFQPEKLKDKMEINNGTNNQSNNEKLVEHS